MRYVERQLQTIKNNYGRFGVTIDVLAFQEVYRPQAERLARIMGIPKENVVFTRTKTNCRNGAEYGNAIAIASRLEIFGAKEHRLITDWTWELDSRGGLVRVPPNHEETKLTALSVKLANGSKVRIYNTHLLGDHSPTDQLIAQLRQPPYFGPREISSLYNAIYHDDQQRTRPYPFVLMGDFNFHRNYPNKYPSYNPALYNQFASTFRDLWLEWQFVNGNPPSLYGLTWSHPTQTKRLDYIAAGKPHHLAANVPQLRVFSAAVPAALNANGVLPRPGETPVKESDHRPVVAILNF
jgi:endonuclease/exonuclease/phosphatase family metal-dependent hydrolase